MNEKTRAKINELLSDPDALISKKPFFRGSSTTQGMPMMGTNRVGLNETMKATLPKLLRNVISQEVFIQELDPDSHKVLFDENIPTITAKVSGGGWAEIQYRRMAVPWQKLIKDKHLLHLCANPMEFTLMNTEPTEKQNKDFITIKQYWDLKNMNGRRDKMVEIQKSYGDAGLLFYFDNNDELKARTLSYADGYVLCPHNDDNGDRILESVYYSTEDGEYIDSYDDTNMYRIVRLYDNENGKSDWVAEDPVPHGFSEIPLITHRGEVAWNAVQSIIEVYEVIYNVFMVIQKRHGWGILYIKGQFKDKGKRLAGNIILNDTSLDGKGSAEFKTPPTPASMLETLDRLEETIQRGAGATLLLPKDVKSSGDISGLAIMLTQSGDIETAERGAKEWQNSADKMIRLFVEGLAKELVKKDKNSTAITDFDELNIHASFKPWEPRSETEYNNMIIALKQSGCISEVTAIESNTVSAPDEKIRKKKEKEEAQKELEKKAKEEEVKEVDVVEQDNTTKEKEVEI